MNFITLQNKNQQPIKSQGEAFAATNIALIKYWGKRDSHLNLPLTNSLSISVDGKGTHTVIKPITGNTDVIFVNKEKNSIESSFAQRIIKFLDLFRLPQQKFEIQTENNIPTAAGLASSASGFAALTLALNDLYDWQFDKKTLSIFARLGSGSACRSVYNGFVEWQKGSLADGSDSFALPLDISWPELKIGLLILSSAEKPISSRIAMQRTIETSSSYQQWPALVEKDLALLKTALFNKDFTLLGETAEHNAIAMHQTMRDAHPTIDYDLTETRAIKEKVKSLRKQGLPIYCTQDAGPNIKLLYLADDEANIKKHFSLF